MVGLPPAMPFTVQFKVGLEPSFVFATNCWVVRPGSVAGAGVTMIV